MRITVGSMPSYNTFRGNTSWDVEIYKNGPYICINCKDYQIIDFFPYWSSYVTVKVDKTGQVLYKYIPPNKK